MQDKVFFFKLNASLYGVWSVELDCAKAGIAKLSCVGKTEQACCINTSSDVICYSVKWQAILRRGLEVRAEFQVVLGEVMKLNLT